MSKILVGSTGVVGKTLSEQISFDLFFNSKNINTFSELVNDGDDLFLSCLPAQKWLINQNIISDFNNISNIIEDLSKAKYNNIILISTIDVYLDSPLEVDEDYNINLNNNLHYGTNRYLFEILVSKLKYNNLKIFRLPGIFGKHIKKNIIYDLINDNNIDNINKNSSYQWYNLENLNKDIEYLSNKYPNDVLFNIFTEPIETSDIMSIFDKNETGVIGQRSDYNFKTKYDKSGYLYDKNTVIEEIKRLKYELVS